MPQERDILHSLEQVIPDLSEAANWLPCILSLDPATLEPLVPRQRVNDVIREASVAISASRPQEAANRIALGLYLYPDRTEDEIRRSGIFRSSKYEFQSGSLRRVLTILLQQQTSLELSEVLVQYIRSSQNLLYMSNPIRRLDASIRRFILKRQNVLLKTVVALADQLFMTDHCQDLSVSTDEWQHYSKEELAEAASYIIFCFDDDVGIKDHHFHMIDEKALVRGLYHSLLVKACKVRRFREAEVMIDAFGYRCQRSGRSVRIQAPYPKMEMSIRLGFIQQEQAKLRTSLNRVEAMQRGETSIFTLADDFYDQFHEEIVQLLEWPIRRYAFALPDAPKFTSFFSHDGLLVEEGLFLDEILNTELATWEEMKRFKVRGDLTVFDLLKVNRLFIFLAYVTRKCLGPVLDDEPHLAYRSLVPVFDDDKVNTLLGWCLPQEKIRAMLSVLSWTSGTAGVIDLQYTPILRGVSHYLSPLNLTGTMNWYRNLAYTQKTRVIRWTDEDGASRDLAKAIRRVCQHVEKTFETTLGGERVEIDVICRFDDHLFIFECKHALPPCNMHELRTSYDHMKKAAKTLTRIRELLKQWQLEQQLYKRLGWNHGPALEIVTCIVSCNGMFPALSLEGHPVRRFWELTNMIESGVIRFGLVNLEEGTEGACINQDRVVERNLWDGSALTPRLLRRYIQEDLLHKPIFEAMVEVERCYRIGNSDIIFETFGLDPIALEERLKKG
ncbi:MAG: hypothetical protein OXI20_17240 [Rhodospirillales bacterium]|nr:hypothetical protein [Rhodospirillales bacterium]